MGISDKGLKLLGMNNNIFKLSIFDLMIKSCKDKFVKKFDLLNETFEELFKNSDFGWI
jgi:hypothetical protein